MLDAERWMSYLAAFRALGPVTETLFVATLLHALAALVFSNFRFASFFERAHSGFQICEGRFNHLIRHIANPVCRSGIVALRQLPTPCGFCATMIMARLQVQERSPK